MMRAHPTITGWYASRKLFPEPHYIGHYGRQDHDDTLAHNAEFLNMDLAAIEVRVATNLLYPPGLRRYLFALLPRGLKVAIIMRPWLLATGTGCLLFWAAVAGLVIHWR